MTREFAEASICFKARHVGGVSNRLPGQQACSLSPTLPLTPSPRVPAIPPPRLHCPQASLDDQIGQTDGDFTEGGVAHDLVDPTLVDIDPVEKKGGRDGELVVDDLAEADGEHVAEGIQRRHRICRETIERDLERSARSSRVLTMISLSPAVCSSLFMGFVRSSVASPSSIMRLFVIPGAERSDKTRDPQNDRQTRWLRMHPTLLRCSVARKPKRLALPHLCISKRLVRVGFSRNAQNSSVSWSTGGRPPRVNVSDVGASRARPLACCRTAGLRTAIRWATAGRPYRMRRCFSTGDRRSPPPVAIRVRDLYPAPGGEVI